MNSRWLSEKIKTFCNDHKNMVTNFCFGGLLLINLVAIPIALRKITETSGNESWRHISPISPFWYEQTKEARIFFEQQNINLIMACCIMASLLYLEHKKFSFLCLCIPLFYVIGQSFI